MNGVAHAGNIRAKVDVLVAGGGLGGVAAATAAARAGAKTLLIERNAFLGGVATAGLCCSIFNCYHTTKGELGVSGISLEVTDALAEAEGFGGKWHAHKGHIIFDVETAKAYFDDLVTVAGADILFQTSVSEAIMDGEVLRGVVVESKSGRQAILADVVVDATGDSDVAFLAGTHLHTEHRGADTLIFRMGNVDVDEFVDYFVQHPDQYPDYMDVDWTFEEALAQYRDTGTFLFPHGGAMQMDIFKRAREDGRYPDNVGLQGAVDACQIHAFRNRGTAHIITGMIKYEGLDVARTTQALRNGREMAHIVGGFFHNEVPGFSRAFVVQTAPNLGTRISRWLDAEFTFTADMRAAETRFPDAIGRCTSQRDTTKHQGDRAWGVHTFFDTTYDIPLRVIMPRNVDNLLIGSGRSVSVEPPNILRAMPQTMIIGQGAGVAAAVASKAGVAVRNVDMAAVQEELRRQGVVVG